MTREALLARRVALLPIYQNPNPEHELQAVEVEEELAWIRTALSALPRETKTVPIRGRGSRGTDRAAGRDG